MPDPRAIYNERIDRVIDYVRDHLDRSLTLDELAGVAFFSPHHFHRIFTAVTGETVNFFTNRLRLEKAARLLKYSGDSATRIALDCGFSSSATFSRSFKQHFGITPREYKKSGEFEKSKIRKEMFPIHEYILPMSVEEMRAAFPVRVKEFPERRVAFIRVTAAYEEDRVLQAFGRMEDWARTNGLHAAGTYFGMSLDDPLVTPRENYRYEVCLTVPDDFEAGGHPEISTMTMPRGSFGVSRVSGDLKRVATATKYLFDHWLLESPYEPDHRPAMEIFLDKNKLHDWEHFDLDLCIPVGPLRGY